jgi:voltage-gated potassium channel Kch
MVKRTDEQNIEQYKYYLLSIATLVTLTVGTLFYHFVEKLRFLDAVYFSVVTLATVGYGDFSPKTDIGKIFTIFYIITGIGILAAFANMIIRRAAERRISRRKSK